MYTAVPAPTRNLETGQATAAGPHIPVADAPAGLSADRNGWRPDCGGGPARARVQARLPVRPVPDDTVTHGGIVWSIVSVAEGANGGWWRLQLRRPRPV